MEQMDNVVSVKSNEASVNTGINIDINKIDNSVLKRLIGEIDFERENRIHAYNRTHNRHNRGR